MDHTKALVLDDRRDYHAVLAELYAVALTHASLSITESLARFRTGASVAVDARIALRRRRAQRRARVRIFTTTNSSSRAARELRSLLGSGIGECTSTVVPHMQCGENPGQTKSEDARLMLASSRASCKFKSNLQAYLVVTTNGRSSLRSITRSYESLHRSAQASIGRGREGYA